jgi:hypothetical protein
MYCYRISAKPRNTSQQNSDQVWDVLHLQYKLWLLAGGCRRTWRSTTRHQANIKAAASKVGYRWRNLELSNCWSLWRAYVLHRRAKATAAVTAARHWRHRRLVKVWKAWRSKVQLRRRHTQVNWGRIYFLRYAATTGPKKLAGLHICFYVQCWSAVLQDVCEQDGLGYPVIGRHTYILVY